MARSQRQRLSLESGRIRLAWLWFVGGGFIVLLIVFQSTFGNVYVDHNEAVWSWILPTLIPTLSLIIAALGANALSTDESVDDQIVVRRGFFGITCWLSVSYLAVILATLIATFFPPEGVEDPFTILQTSHFWLSPMQGLVVAAMGVLFFTKVKTSATK